MNQSRVLGPKLISGLNIKVLRAGGRLKSSRTLKCFCKNILFCRHKFVNRMHKKLDIIKPDKHML